MNDIQKLLKEKIDKCYAEYLSEWLRMSPVDLIAYAKNIADITSLAEKIPQTCSDEKAKYLLQFKNPLAVVSDALDYDNNLEHILWELEDKCAAECDYEMDNCNEENFEMGM